MRNSSSAPLPPPRFSLRTLLLAVTGLSVGFGLCWWLSAPAIAAVVFLAVIVGAHVFGNAVGTRLRNGRIGSSPASLDANPTEHDFGKVAPSAPATHLGERWSLGWGLVVSTLLGVLGGMIGGCVLIESVYRIGFDLSGMAVAGAGFGVLGGFASFAVASFSQVLCVALLQALRHK